VKKPGGAAPGKVIYDHYKTVYVKPSQFEDLFGSK
jgi:predicted ribosome quality control (RQC) complex YloA/Tae2 family protein